MHQNCVTVFVVHLTWQSALKIVLGRRFTAEYGVVFCLRSTG